MSTIEFLNAAADVVPAAEIHAQGVLGWIGDKAVQVETLIKVLATVVAVGFVVYRAIASVFKWGTIIMTALLAGAFIWIVHNVDFVQQKVEEEVESAPHAIEQLHDDVVGRA